MKRLTKIVVSTLMGSSLWGLPIKAIGFENYAETLAETLVSEQATNSSSEHLIRDMAKLITVRVFSINQQEWESGGLILDGSGSGILIQKKQVQNNTQAPHLYLILTNNHVVRRSKNNQQCGFYAQTHDGLIHKACLHPKIQYDKTDLALLYFYSPHDYKNAVLESDSTSLKDGDKVFVSGFPCDLGSTSVPCPGEFKFISGEVKLVRDKPLVYGYQIGYTNKVIEGTSGGPVLNSRKKVVGVNGLREGGNDSTYQNADNSQPPPTKEEIEEMRQLRWGISIDEYQKFSEQVFDGIPPPNSKFKKVYYVSETETANNQNENENLNDKKDGTKAIDDWSKISGSPDLMLALALVMVAPVALILLLIYLMKQRATRNRNSSPKSKQLENYPKESGNHQNAVVAQASIDSSGSITFIFKLGNTIKPVMLDECELSRTLQVGQLMFFLSIEYSSNQETRLVVESGDKSYGVALKNNTWLITTKSPDIPTWVRARVTVNKQKLIQESKPQNYLQTPQY